MSTAITIRQKIPSDGSKLKKIIDLSFSWFLGFFAAHSITEEGPVLVAETQATVVGFAKPIEFKVGGNKFGCILWVAVQPEFRRRGVATALIKTGTQRLKQEGAKAVFASVQRRNIASLTVFTNQGFSKKSFADLWRLFNWRVFQFYGDIWLAPGEIVLMHD